MFPYLVQGIERSVAVHPVARDAMKRLEKQLKALQDRLTNLSARADKARGQTRRRLKRLERRTRVKVERTVRALEPKVRQAVAEAAVIARTCAQVSA
jgi:hypothetical protein